LLTDCRLSRSARSRRMSSLVDIRRRSVCNAARTNLAVLCRRYYHPRRLRLLVLRSVRERDEPQHQSCNHGACNPIGDLRPAAGPYPRKSALVPIVLRYRNPIGRIHNCVPRLLVEHPRIRPPSNRRFGQKVRRAGKTVRSSQPPRHVEKREQCFRPTDGVLTCMSGRREPSRPPVRDMG
jgi:hypothetical protein